MTSDRWITAGVTLAAVVLGILRNEFAIGGVNRHIDGVETHLSQRITDLDIKLTSRIDSLEKVMDARFEAADQSLLRVEKSWMHYANGRGRKKFAEL